MKNDTDGRSGYKTKKNTTKKMRVNGFLFYTFMPVLIVLARMIYGVKIDKSAIKKQKGPFLVLGNHSSPIDFLFYCGSIYPKKITFVVASNMYYTKLYGTFIKMYHCISKRQFTADFNCIKMIKRYLDSGTSVLLFPEGRVTIDGTTGDISPTIGKLVKWLNYPVVTGVTDGGYVSRPKWGKARNVKVRLKVEQIMSADDIKNMTQEEIYKVIKVRLQHNDNQVVIDNGWKIKGRNIAEGLEKVLYKCPKCGAEFQNVTKGDFMTCKTCGNSVQYCRDGRLRAADDGSKCFELINEWNEFQRKDLRRQIEDENFALTDRVRFVLSKPSIGQFSDEGEGVLSVSKEGIVYNGDNKTSYSFKIQNHPSLAFVMGENIEISEDENIYRFEFIQGLYSTKYVLAIEELYKKYYAKTE